MVETLILVGDAATRLKELPDNYVNCVVTSPPYYGLRDYGTAGEWEGGNDPSCKHVLHHRAKQPQAVHGRTNGQQWVLDSGKTIYPNAGISIGNNTFKCSLCEATKTDYQIGLETTPDDYIESMIEVCKEVKRVLRSDGTFWLNVGDSYTSSGSRRQTNDPKTTSYMKDEDRNTKINGVSVSGLKPKNLIGIPWLLAFALQKDGWILRSEIIWSKIAALPENVDRPSTSHEKIFLLTKSPNYFFDEYAVQDKSVSEFNKNNEEYRPTRSVWELGPEPTSDWHFATFPSSIPRRCILSGLGQKGVCAKCCGAPWKSTKGHAPWTPTCKCNCSETVPGMVLDPFLGSGTTAMVANSLRHNCVGIELNPINAKKARDRIYTDGKFSRTVDVVETALDSWLESRV